jgi:hypothetical protein
LLKLPLKRRDASLTVWTVLGEARQHTDPPYPLALLRACDERPSRRTAEQRDEIAAPHSITSSARASTVAGTSMPSAFGDERAPPHWAYPEAKD